MGGTLLKFNEFIEQRRIERGLSRRQLALRCGLSHTEIYRIEKGVRKCPSFRALKGLADGLRIPEAEMYSAAGVITDSDIAPSSEQIRITRLVNDLHLYDLSDENIRLLQPYADFLFSNQSQET